MKNELLTSYITQTAQSIMMSGTFCINDAYWYFQHGVEMKSTQDYAQQA